MREASDGSHVLTARPMPDTCPASLVLTQAPQSELHGLILEMKTLQPVPEWRGSVGWAAPYKPKGHWFNSQSGHMPGWWGQVPGWEHVRGHR